MLRRRTRVDTVIGPLGVPVVVQRTNRKKTVGIIVENGDVRIRAPKRLANWRIQELIDERTEWISAKLRLQAERTRQLARRYVNDESFVFLGETYRLKIVDDQDRLIAIENDCLVAPRSCDHATHIKAWYRHQAETVLGETTDRFAVLMGVVPRSVAVREYKSQWGSCNSRGDIRYNSRLVMAPAEVIDYVVVHELGHLLHLNHSSQYWERVGEILPDHRARRKWLRKYGSTLQI